MSLAGIYPWMKALHVASVLVFVGGVVAAAVFLRSHGHDTTQPGSATYAMRRWDRMATTPAMLLVWAFGFELAISGHWFQSAWLQAKLVLVILLSGIHGVQSGRLRRLSRGRASNGPRAEPLMLACILGISILVVVKPF
jgi:putative membrane protein